MKPKLKPRNPLVAAAKFRRAGVHEKTTKARRQQDNQALRQAVKQGKDVFSQPCQKRIPGESVSGRGGIAGNAQGAARLL